MNAAPPVEFTLGRVRLRPMGLGTNTWGSWGRAEPGLRAVYDAALQAGVPLLDTAEVYRLGAAERTLGLFLGPQRPLVMSKFHPLPWRLGSRDLIHALRGSLRRLRLSSLDLYLLHFPRPPRSIETWMKALADAVEEGLCGGVGISNCDAEQTRRAHEALSRRGLRLACHQFEYSLLHRAPERDGVLAACFELGITPIAHQPLGRGLLSGSRLQTSSRTDYGPLLSTLDAIARARGKTRAQVALAWVIARGALPIPGTRSPRHVWENAQALELHLQEHELASLNLVSERAHV